MKLMPHDYPGVKPCPKSGPFSQENADKAWRQKLISDCMEKHGLNRRQLAARVGVHATSLTYWLNGQRPLADARVPILVEILESNA